MIYGAIQNMTMLFNDLLEPFIGAEAITEAVLYV